jgi:hypothetical protein
MSSVTARSSAPTIILANCARLLSASGPNEASAKPPTTPRGHVGKRRHRRQRLLERERAVTQAFDQRGRLQRIDDLEDVAVQRQLPSQLDEHLVGAARTVGPGTDEPAIVDVSVLGHLQQRPHLVADQRHDLVARRTELLQQERSAVLPRPGEPSVRLVGGLTRRGPCATQAPAVAAGICHVWAPCESNTSSEYPSEPDTGQYRQYRPSGDTSGDRASSMTWTTEGPSPEAGGATKTTHAWNRLPSTRCTSYAQYRPSSDHDGWPIVRPAAGTTRRRPRR